MSAAPDSPTLGDRIPATWLVLGGIVSVQFGAAVAKQLFGTVSPVEMVFLRLLTSTIVLLAVARPRLRGRSRSDWLTVVLFGLCLAGMNWAIYESFARIPLGVAVTIEFLGPLLLAVAGSRRPRDLVWVVLAAAGVALLGFSPHGLTVPGVLLAVTAGAFWAGYILSSARTGRRWSGISGLALASLVALLTVSVPVAVTATPALVSPRVLLIGALVGLLSSVVPYSLELIALRRMPAKVFGILMSLEPAAAALAALLVLGELLRGSQWLAMVCVVVASAGATWAGRARRSSPDLISP